MLPQRKSRMLRGAIAVAYAVLFASCRIVVVDRPTGESSVTERRSFTSKLTFSGSEAVHFIQALRNAGIAAKITADGADRVAADTITCHNDHTVTGPVECVITAGGKSLPMTGDDASMVFNTLRTSDSSPSHTVTATDVTCGAITKPLAEVTCSFTR